MNTTATVLNLQAKPAVQQGQNQNQGAQTTESRDSNDFFSKLKEATEAPDVVENVKAQDDGNASEKIEIKTDEMPDDDVLSEVMPIMIPIVQNVEDAPVAAEVEQEEAPVSMVTAEAEQTVEIAQVQPEQTEQTEAPIVREIMNEVQRAVDETENKDADAEPVTVALEVEGKVAEAVRANESANAGQNEEHDEDTEKHSTADSESLTSVHEAAQFERTPQIPVIDQIQTDTPEQVRETFTARLVDQVYTAVTENKSELFIQLKPEHLGGLTLALSMTEKGLTAKLSTSSMEVQYMLNNELSILQQSLRDKGINVVQMEVIYDQMTNMAGRDFAREGNGGGQSGETGRGKRDGGIAAAFDMNEVTAVYDTLLEPESSREFNA